MKANTVIDLVKKACAAGLEIVENCLANSGWLDGRGRAGRGRRLGQ